MPLNRGVIPKRTQRLNYGNGEHVCLWDRVQFPDGGIGIVVFSIDDDEYSIRFPKEQWSYLERGVMVDTSFGGLVHYPKSLPRMELLRHGETPTPEEWASLRKAQFDTAGSEWRSGNGKSVKIGYVNPNGQICTGHRGASGTDHLQRAYRMECGLCGYMYGANGSDIHERRCPACQSGAPGIAY